ncbi:Gmad2 immunoglobulin-like domain-containing protein [Phytoactinopolyspora limicola]|uniref:Gmad2 immunoglobulin-like domain-containing protein n=1 Tax=Phytoactinopolyspora limicola TaxID=2715536 RepID=UPI00140B86EC|nr:Gmad2 immunoglobulin-like domain-containing protein [Phytoactinopolyspora limicola]
MSEQWSPEEQHLRDALRSAADKITPGPDGLARIRRRTAQPPWWRRPAVIAVAAGTATAAAAVVVVVNLTGQGEGELSVQPVDTPTVTEPPLTDEPTAGLDEPTPDPTQEDTPPPDDPDPEDTAATATDPGDEQPDTTEPPTSEGDAEQVLTLPVYYTVDNRLTREWQQVRTADPLGAAVHQALNGEALDPRYGSLWEPVDVVSAQVTDGVIEIGLRSPVRLAGDPEYADVAVQQLVYTATATAASVLGVEGTPPVRVLVDGEPTDDLFGQVDVSDPVGRADQADVRYFVQVDSPGYGAQTGSPVRVTGVAAVFEATVLWELTKDGEVLDSGFETTGEAFTFSEFSIDLGELEPGTYEITVKEEDVSDGEGRAPFYDTKRFDVVAP